MNNQLSDIKVGGLNFQPMPKRFMVWDKKEGAFLRRAGTGVFNIPSLVVLAKTLDITLDDYDEFAGKLEPRYIVCQSTNLFDENGEEIFEGSIIRDEDEGYFSVVENRDGEYCGVDPYNKEVIDSISAMKSCSEVIGHILSNPELLEEEQDD